MASEAYTTVFFYSDRPPDNGGLYLSLLIGADTFMYAISNGEPGNVSELCHVQLTRGTSPVHGHAESIISLINNHRLHQQKFKKVNIALLSKDFTIVPQAYASGNDVRSFLQFATGIAEVKNILKHHIADASFCFSAGNELTGYLEKTFANASLRHTGAVAVGLLFSHHALKNVNLLLVIGNSSVELAARNNNELLFYNVFGYESNEDVLYYLLFTMEQLGLSPVEAHLGIACERPVGDELIKSIKKYIRQVDLCVHDRSVSLKGDAAKLPAHYYFTLLNQYLCEL